MTLFFFFYHQTHCEQVVDKYVEVDAVVLLLDILLLRIQSYRHLIFNYGIDFAVYTHLYKAGLGKATCAGHGLSNNNYYF